MKGVVSLLLKQSKALKLKWKLLQYWRNDVFIHPATYLGENTIVGKGTNITGKAYIESDQENPVVIGRYCAIAHHLRIRSINHNIRYPNMQYKLQRRYGFKSFEAGKGCVSIGNACWIGDNVTVLAGVSIGDGAIVGAGSVVTRDIPSFSIAAGNPAKIIRKRFHEKIIHQLEAIEWWKWDEAVIAQNAKFFNTDLTQYDGNVFDLIQKEQNA